MLFKKDSDVKNLREELKIVFSKIKEELEDHLESINQNTLEIHSNYEYISLLNNKIEKIAEKIAFIELKLKEIDNNILKNLNNNTINNEKTKNTEKNNTKKINEEEYTINIKKNKKVENIFITREEEEILAILIEYKRKKALLSYETIAKKLEISKNYVIELINNLLEKKIPIEKKYFDEKVFLEINNQFLKNEEIEYNFITID